MFEVGHKRMNTPTSMKYKRYGEAFKRSAVGDLLVSGKSVRGSAREMGVNEQSLANWKQRFKALPAGQAKRRYRVTLTDSNHDLPIAPNRLRHIPPRPSLMRCGWQTSPMWTRMKAGFTWLVSWAGTPAGARAGRWGTRWPPASRWPPWTWRSCTASHRADSSITPTAASNTPAKPAASA